MPLPTPVETDNYASSIPAGLDKTTQVTPRPMREGTNLGENGMPQVSDAFMVSDVEGALVAMYGGIMRDTSDERIAEFFNGFFSAIDRADSAQKAEYCDYLLRLVFNTRDCRGGKGERSVFRNMLIRAYDRFPHTVEALVQYIPYYGYWNDLNEMLILIRGLSKFDGLRNQIYKVFAEQLQIDWKNYEKYQEDKMAAESRGEEFKQKMELTLVAKWAPKEGSKYDKQVKAAKELARHLFEAEFKMDYRRALKAYRKMTTTLNRAIKTTETLMCEKRFSEINFRIVPGKCLTKYRKAFLNQKVKGEEVRHPNDEDRIACRENLLKYMEDVKSGKKKINSGQLFIHEIVEKCFGQSIYYDNNIDNEEVELYSLCWKGIVDKYKEQISNGEINMGKGVVLADVSGSMSGTPMMVSIATAIFVSELMEGPYANRFMTFDTTPKWFSIPETATFIEKVGMVRDSPWGGSTDFIRAMENILDVARENSLQPEQMPEWFLVLSDMQFDCAQGYNSRNSWETIHERLVRRFAEVGMEVCGREYTLPHMIYWNLRGDTDGFPVVHDQKGCQLVSGFSVAILKEIFNNRNLNDITPWKSLKSTLDGQRYEHVSQMCKSVAEAPYFMAYESQREADRSSPQKNQGLFGYLSSFFY